MSGIFNFLSFVREEEGKEKKITFGLKPVHIDHR